MKSRWRGNPYRRLAWAVLLRAVKDARAKDGYDKWLAKNWLSGRSHRQWLWKWLELAELEAEVYEKKLKEIVNESR